MSLRFVVGVLRVIISILSGEMSILRVENNS